MSDGRKNPGIKIPHLSIVDRPIVGGTRCVMVRIPDDDRYMPVLAGLVAIGNQWFNWERDNAHTGTLLAQQWKNAYLETDWDGCMNCEELTACLQPLFDAIGVQITDLSTQVTNLQQVIDNSTQVLPPLPYTLETCTYGNMYSAALMAVEQVNLLISGIYKRAEVEAPDNLAEGTELLLSAVPFFETLPFDELFSLVQWTFDNQKATYDADYVADIAGHAWFEHAAGVLWCLVKDTCTINHEIVGMWLSSLSELYPGNYAAEVFTRFGAATTPTMINQIGEALDSLRGGQSLAAFFDDVIVQFGVGAQNTNPDYVWFDCPVPPTRIPVIQLLGTCENSYSGDYGGADIVDLGGGSWSVTATVNATMPPDYRITIKDTADRPFVLTSISHPGSSGCWGWNAVSGGCYTSLCSGGLDADGIEITDYFVTGPSVFTMTFTMSVP